MYYQIDGSRIRLAGSIHRIPPGTTIPQWVADAYQWSEEIYLEANKDDLPKCVLLPAGQSSEQKMPASIWAALRTCWPASASQLGPQKLWLIAMVIALTGIPTADGVEAMAIERSRADGRNIKYLETVAEFAQLLDGIPDDEYVKALDAILDSTTDVRSSRIADLYAAWISGQPEAVAIALRASALTQFPAKRQAIFDIRNAMWLPRIIDVLGSQKRTVIFVGAGRLGGANGPLALLSRAGHTSTLLLNI